MKQLFLLTLLFILSISTFAQQKQEIRAVWLATNYRIDWPSKAYMNSDDINQQQDEFIDILDKLKEANVNMVFLQTRLNGDVIYKSKIEPLSPYIEGIENTWSKYDPLKFTIAECHKRGIECHAWFVAYKAGSKEHVSETATRNFELVKPGEKEFWFDPGNPGTNTYLLSLVKELVRGYDIDGLHLDYVRYPAETSEFPDDDTYKKYGNGGDKSDWRRENITRFVTEAYDAVKAIKPWVQVSCAVVPYYTKLDGTNQTHWTAYSDAFQDPEEWMRKGKVDFITPMIYNRGELFNLAVTDWMNRCYNRFVVAGIGAYLLNESEKGGNWTLKNIADQILYSRTCHTHGLALYSAKHLTSNKKGLLTELKNNQYKTPALLPPLSWLSTTVPPEPRRPKATAAGDYVFLRWDEQKTPDENKLFYNVYRSSKHPVDISDPNNLIATRVEGSSLFIPAEKRGYHYVVTSYDRYHNESPASKGIFFKP